MISEGIDFQELRAVQQCVSEEVRQAAAWALSGENPQPIFDAKAPLPEAMRTRAEYRGDDSEPRLTMREVLNRVLCHRLVTDPRVVLDGEDIEDPKGDVFSATRGLSTGVSI